MANADNREIYIAYCMGEDVDSEKLVYTEPHTIFANVSEPVSFETLDNIGRIPEYDRTLVVEVGEKTEFIREDSILWIDTLPNENKDNYDYVISRVGDVVNGKMKVYCNAVTPSLQVLYYSNDKTNIYQIKVFFNGLVAVVPKNMYFPVTSNTDVWYLKPDSVETTKGKIKFVDKIEYIRTYAYVFEDVEWSLA